MSDSAFADYNEFVKQHRKRSWFKMQAADKK